MPGLSPVGWLAVTLALGSLGCAGREAASPSSQPVRVEPESRLTFGPAGEVPPGTSFHIQVVKVARNTLLYLNRCGVPCNTTLLVAFWFSHGYAAGDVLSRKAELGGTYYLWMREQGREDASMILSDEVIGSRTRMTFDSGAILKAWYVAP